MNLLVKFYSSSEKWLKIKNQSSKLDYYAPSYLTHTVIWSNFPKEFFAVKVQKKKKRLLFRFIYLLMKTRSPSTYSIEFLFFFSSPKAQRHRVVGEAKGLRFIRLFHVRNPWRDIDSALSSVNRPSNTGNEICPELSRLNIAPGFDFLPEGRMGE